jgi:hypothetical protein
MRVALGQRDVVLALERALLVGVARAIHVAGHDRVVDLVQRRLFVEDDHQEVGGILRNSGERELDVHWVPRTRGQYTAVMWRNTGRQP